MRTSTISAAASGRPAATTSATPLSSICQVRESTRMESFSAKARPRARSTSISAGSAATAGTIFTRVAHRAFGCARDQSKRLGLDFDGFPARNRFQMLHQQTGIDPTQIEALAARQNGDGNLADFRGGEDELGVRRRLFQGLEQGVEGL